MTDRPILFSSPMVRALLDGRKTQTRRVITKKAAHNALAIFGADFLLLPGNVDLIGYAPGDRLWVREGFSGPYGCRNLPPRDWPNAGPIWHWADGNPEHGDWTRPKPSIHMPRWASRLTLTVTNVRVQRLQEISDPDAAAEGVEQRTVTKLDGSDPQNWWFGHENGRATAKSAFRDLWDSLNADRAPWLSNRWVCAVSFAVHKCNIDQVGVAA